MKGKKNIALFSKDKKQIHFFFFKKAIVLQIAFISPVLLGRTLLDTAGD